MWAIIIPLFIIAILVGFYYAGDVWNDVKSSVPFFGDKELKLPGSQEKSDSSPAPNSPFDTFK